MANKILELQSNVALYELLSKNSAKALQGLYIGEDWCDLMRLFINDPENKTQWTKERSLRYLLI